MKNNRISPKWINNLKENEIFVFGSNLSGIHSGGAAYWAIKLFGAKSGIGIGIQGNSYAIPTVKKNFQGIIERKEVFKYVLGFVDYAIQNKDKTFLVTEIGCGIAGYTVPDIANLFRIAGAEMYDNIHLPESFWNYIKEINESNDKI